MSIADILGSITYFSDLPSELLEEVASVSEMIDVTAGTVIIEEGSNSTELSVLVTGELIVTVNREGQQVEIDRIGAGEVFGELAFINKAPRSASVVAATDSTTLRIPADEFERLLNDPGVARRMFGTVIARLRNHEATLRHAERMVALGRMAAQLMHELNNPAAAIGRSSQELGQVQNSIRDVLHDMDLIGVDPPPPQQLSPMQRADEEEAVGSWLTDRGVEDAWSLAPALVRDGWTRTHLEAAGDGLSNNLIRYIALRAMAGQLTDEIRIGAGRVSELVRIVKDYSYLDQAPIQDLVVTGGIEDTLVLLRHKLADIKVVTDFPSDLPPVGAPGRDLNQVWTNLIANAAEAMNGEGTLTIRATSDDRNVVVTITDTGEGIPPDVLPRIFDPFFTTKGPGEGTGLGLHTVYSIVNRIGGTITADSDRGGTTFTVRLPQLITEF